MAGIGLLGWASLAATGLSAASSYSASKQQELNDRAAAEANAKRAMAQAKDAAAAGQLKSNEARRRAEIMTSRALAVAAASGAGTAGIETLMSGIAESGERAAQAENYQATESAKGLEDRAALGKNAAEAYASRARVDRTATLVGAAAQSGSLASKYGGEPPSGSSRAALQDASRQYQYD